MKRLLFGTHGSDVKETGVFNEAINGLCAYVHGQLQTQLPVTMQQVPGDQLIEVIKALTDDDNYCFATDEVKKLLGGDDYLIIGCGKNTAICRSARRAEPSAEYGLARPCARFASVYDIFTEAVWHEALHLFGVYDCYPPSPKCKNVNCLMQYDPKIAAVNAILCEGARNELNSWIRKAAC